MYHMPTFETIVKFILINLKYKIWQNKAANREEWKLSCDDLIEEPNRNLIEK